ncbi:MAG: UTP--glucose-1-phosphate uridylyltransferase [Clostridia bacterium]|nr:UTP--glucose-1-phosphate uridylyltransferase [Clostridia bacterium]
MSKLEEIKTKLAAYGQDHLIAFVGELSDSERESLLTRLETLDLELAKKLYEGRNDISTGDDKIEPMAYVDRLKLSDEENAKYIAIGEEILKAGKFASVTMAGGQGTRLGHSGPKGTYMVEVGETKSLFEITCETLKRAYVKYNAYIPWYIMTSRENNDDTVKFFETNNYFGYPKEYVAFFKQGELPMIGETGKILLETKSMVREAADGHGGIFEAMNKNDIVKDMKSRGIEWIFIGGIDNILLNIVDPLFIGMAKDAGVKAASKTIVKANPAEKVGVFCKRNGRPSVIEYSEISEEMANLRDENGELLYGESHILCNLFNIDALELIGHEKLPYHAAHKKSNYIAEDGSEFVPEAPNAYKFEAFIFDAFSKVEDMLLLRSLREHEFAPIKNKEGVDSPETAVALYKAHWNV